MLRKIFILSMVVVLALSMCAFTTSTTTVKSLPPPPPPFTPKTVVDVTYEYTNDQDSSFAGPTWALDTIYRHLVITETGFGKYSFVLTDTGTFVTIGGLSPQNGDPLTPGVKGTITGGMSGKFFGFMKKHPGKATTGDIGVFDGGGFNWAGTYFYWPKSVDDIKYSWGWTYTACNGQTWVNADSGNVGDIIGNPVCAKTILGGWVPTGITYWKLEMSNPPAGSWGFYKDDGSKIGLCVIYTDGPLPAVETQTKLCGASWVTNYTSHAFVEYAEEGLTKYYDTWSLNWGDPFATAP